MTGMAEGGERQVCRRGKPHFQNHTDTLVRFIGTAMFGKVDFTDFPLMLCFNTSHAAVNNNAGITQAAG